MQAVMKCKRTQRHKDEAFTKKSGCYHSDLRLVPNCMPDHGASHEFISLGTRKRLP